MPTMFALKRPVGSCGLAWLLTTVNKDLFESSETCLFTSNSANQAVAYASLCAAKLAFTVVHLITTIIVYA